jgi:hypothetical protein
MAWTYIGGTTKQVTSTSSTSFSAYSPGSVGNLLVVGCTIYQNNGPLIVSDNQNNSWYRASFAKSGDDTEIWYAIAKTTSSTTVTITARVANAISGSLDEFSPPAGNILCAYSAGGTGTSTTPSSGNMTVASSALVYGVVSNVNAAGTYTAGSSFTLTGHNDGSAGLMGCATEYYLNDSTNPTAATFTFGNSVTWDCAGAVFLTQTAGSWSHVQGSGAYVGTATSVAAAFPVNVTSGNLMVVGVYINGPGTVSIGDTRGLSFTQQETSTHSSDYVSIWTAPISSGGAETVTIQLGANTYGLISIDEYSYSGGATYALEASGGGNAGNGSSTTPSPGSVTVTGTDLVYAICGDLSPGFETTSAGSSFGLRYFGPGYTGVSYGFAAQDYLNATSNQTGSFTVGASVNWIAAAIAMKPTSTAGGGAYNRWSVLRPYGPSDIQYAWRD